MNCITHMSTIPNNKQMRKVIIKVSLAKEKSMPSKFNTCPLVLKKNN